MPRSRRFLMSSKPLVASRSWWSVERNRWSLRPCSRCSCVRILYQYASSRNQPQRSDPRKRYGDVERTLLCKVAVVRELNDPVNLFEQSFACFECALYFLVYANQKCLALSSLTEKGRTTTQSKIRK
ncbi:hypothetical protein KCU77_g41, partial [Aureobasidium melanogenum]